MKNQLRIVFTLLVFVLKFLPVALQADSATAQVTVSLTPSTGQWRINGGAWRTSGSTANGLPSGNHVVEYNALSGYTAPATETVTLAPGQALSLSRTYTAASGAANLRITLTPSTGRWRIDGGAWRNSGFTLYDLTAGSHLIEYYSLANYVTPASETVTLVPGANSFARSYAELAQLTVVLTPSTCRWRIDGGGWRNNNTIAYSLPLGSHLIEYWDPSSTTALPAETVTLAAGAVTLNRTLLPAASSAQLTVTLTPGTGQWRVDGGTWRNSGTTATGLANGSHTVEYNSLTGYTTPATETVTLTTAQSLALNRSYTVAPTQLTVTLTPATSQWRVDGGAWQASGATVSGLAPGDHTVEYNSFDGYRSPPSETITLTAGQVATLSRSYVPLLYTAASTGVAGVYDPTGLQPGGGYAINLEGAVTGTSNLSGNVRGYIYNNGSLVDLGSLGGPSISLDLNDSGVAAGFSLIGSFIDRHAFRYANGVMQDLGLLATGNLLPNSTAFGVNSAGDVVGQCSNAAASGQRAFLYSDGVMYDLGTWGGQQAAALDINDADVIVGSTYVSATVWQAIRYYEGVVEIIPGLGGTLNRASAVNNAGVIVGDGSVSGSAPLHAFRHEAGVTSDLGTLGGANSRALDLNDAGVIVGWAEVAGNTPHAFVYRDSVMLDLNDIVSLPPGVVLTGATGINASGQIIANGSDALGYILTPVTNVGGVSVQLADGIGQWRVDGGAWQNASAIVSGLVEGSHTIEYATVADYTAPADETVNVNGGRTAVVRRSYATLPGQLTITLTPATGQWRVDGGAWQASGATISGLAAGNHTVEYNSLTGYTSPATETITLTAGQSLSLSRSYTALPAQVTVTLTPASCRWRIDGGVSRASGTTVTGLSAGTHTVSYISVFGYATPATETITLAPGESLSLNRSYVPLPAQLTIGLQQGGQWRINGGAWNAGYATVSGLAPGTYSIEYLDLTGYTSPPAESVTLSPGESKTLLRTYVRLNAQVNVHLYQSVGRWRIDGGTWMDDDATATPLVGVAHTLDYQPRTGFTAPPSETFTLVENQTLTLERSYTPAASGAVTVHLTPTNGKWRIDDGMWNASGHTIGSLSPGNHTISYLSLTALVSPPSETISVTTGQWQVLDRLYTEPITAELTITLTPNTAQWRVDGGAWQNSGTSATGLLPGSHAISYSTVSGYTTPPTETVTLAEEESIWLDRSYAGPPAQLTITLTPGTAQWRVDGGAWQASGATVATLQAGSYLVEYGGHEPLTSPPWEIVTVSDGQVLGLSRTYTTSPLKAYAVTDLGTLGGTDTQVAALNNHGTIVGKSYLSNGAPHAFEYRNGTMRDVGALGTSVQFSEAQSINDYGMIVGTSSTGVSGARAFRARDGAIKELAMQGLSNDDFQNTRISDRGTIIGSIRRSGVTRWFVYRDGLVDADTGIDLTDLKAFGINKHDDIVGASVTRRAFVLRAGVLQDLSTFFAGIESSAVDINDEGTVVGQGTNSAGYRQAFRYQDGVMKHLGAVDGMSITQSMGLAVNRHNVVVGWSGTYAGPNRAMVTFPNGAMTDLNTLIDLPGVNLLEAVDINDLGQIVARSWDRSYLLTPVYSPTSLQINLGGQVGRWRANGGEWQPGGGVLANLPPGNHFIEYEAAPAGYGQPAPEIVAVESGQNLVLDRQYPLLPARVTITLTPGIGAWRIDGGDWQFSGATVADLAPGSYLIEYAEWAGYTAPATETVTLSAGQLLSISRSYAQLASVQVSINPPGVPGQWRIDGGAWQPAGTTLNNLTYGVPHTVEFSVVDGYAAPAPQTFTLASGEYRLVTGFYTALASLTIHVSPATSGGQWRLDGGAWLPTGATINNLAYDVSHTVEFSPAPGYIAPSPFIFSPVSGASHHYITVYYIPLASVTVHVSPTASGGQWRLDGGAWQPTGATLGSLTFGVPHTVEFSEGTGYVAPAPQTFTLASGENRIVTGFYTPLASVTVHVSPTASGGQWRLDGGDWQPTGTTLNNLTYDVLHTVEFGPAPGYVAPAPQTFTLASGENRIVTGFYTPLASVTVHVSPTASGGQWRLDGGAWQPTGATLNNLTYDVLHTVEFGPATGYVAPAPQTFTLASGESRIVTGFYTPVSSPTQLSVSLSPIRGQWRLDGGEWREHGALVTDLLTGNHTIEYSTLPNYTSPPAETVTLADGESKYLDRAYVLAASVQYSVTDLGSLGGPGATNAMALNLSGMVTGTSHIAGGPARAFLYRDGAMQSLGTLGSDLYSFGHGLNDDGDVVGMSYTTADAIRPFVYRNGVMQDLGSLGGTNGAGYDISNTGFVVGRSQSSPSQGFAFIHDGTAMVSLGSLGGTDHIAYAINEDGTIVGAARVSGDFHAFRWQDGVMEDLNPLLNTSTSYAYAVNEAGTIAGIRIFGGDYRGFSLTAAGVMQDLERLGSTYTYARAINDAGHVVGNSSTDTGNHAFLHRGPGIEDLNHLVNLPGVVLEFAEGINDLGQIAANGSNGHAYLLTPLNAPGGLLVDLTPATGQWRVDGSAWQSSGAALLNLASGNHTVEYGSVSGYTTPAPEAVTIPSGRLLQLARTYAVAPAPAQLTITLTPASGQWRADGGAWQASGATVTGLAPGSHTVEYNALGGYTAPATETVNLTAGQSLSLSRSYTVVASSPATLTITLTPTSGRWRIDGGAWRNSGTTASGLLSGSHTIEYYSLTNYAPPASETVSLVPGTNTLTRSYDPLAQFTVNLTPSTGRWRIDGGAWRNSGFVLYNLPLGAHLIEYYTLTNYTSPASETVSLVAGTNTLARSYAELAQLTVVLTPSTCRWRIDGGTWRNSNTTAYSLPLGSHLIEYWDPAGITVRAPETVTLTAGAITLNRTLSPP